ncbi:MAG TPA: maleylpyruvate isomerase family mycothiol-dependent enzyme [Frankiaceae bacterium]|nr:maleylpyruvate isomerase family mycothiol-dependent enzyme [Frankiaceae bacterium]
MSTPVSSIKQIKRGEGALLSRVEYTRLAQTLLELTEEEWAAPVPDCPGWTVKALASHVLGGLECVRKPKEFVRQYLAGIRLAKKLDLPGPVDGLNEVQIRKYAAMTGPQIAARIADLVEPALRHRMRTPLVLRYGIWTKLDVKGRTPVAWVLDVVYTRDTFLHRLDVARALGRDVEVDEVEGRVIADMVREWAARHGQPVTLRLTGPAGGTYVAGTGGAEVECDAVEWARAVAGRAPAVGLLATSVQI